MLTSQGMAGQYKEGRRMLRIVTGDPHFTQGWKERNVPSLGFTFGPAYIIVELRHLCGANHIKRQVFQYTIDLNSKRRRRRQPDRREKKAPAKAIAKKQPTKPVPSRTPEEITAAEETSQVARREYEQAGNRNPERMEYNRCLAQERRRIAKATGKCKSCPAPAIPSQTRCPRCAEHHRQSRRRSDAKRRATAKQTVTAKTVLSEVSKRDTLHHHRMSGLL